MKMGGSQVAVVMILGGLLLVYGGATGRLTAAWKALSGGGSSKPAEPAETAPDDAPSGEPATEPKQEAKTPTRGVAMVSSLTSNGQIATRPGGFVA